MPERTVQSQFTALGGQIVEIGPTLKPVTPWGGMPVFAGFAEVVGIRKLVERLLVGLVRTSLNAQALPCQRAMEAESCTTKVAKVTDSKRPRLRLINGADS